MARSNRYSDKEHSLIDKYKRENQKLKEQIGKLRKQISRLDLDRYSNIKDLIDQYEAADKTEDQAVHKEEIKKLWECHSCRGDYLRMVTFERRDGVMYYRKCGTCGHRTKLQRLTKDTKQGPAE